MAHNVSNEDIIVGRVADAFGVKGQIKIRTFTEPPTNLLTYVNWTIERKSGEKQTYSVRSGQLHGKFLIAKLNGLETREQALTLKGCDIRVLVQDLAALPEGEYYHFELIGMVVSDVNGHLYGNVEQVMRTGANDVLVVTGARTTLIPYIADVIEQIDMENRKIYVRWYPDFWTT